MGRAICPEYHEAVVATKDKRIAELEETNRLWGQEVAHLKRRRGELEATVKDYHRRLESCGAVLDRFNRGERGLGLAISAGHELESLEWRGIKPEYHTDPVWPGEEADSVSASDKGV